MSSYVDQDDCLSVLPSDLSDNERGNSHSADCDGSELALRNLFHRNRNLPIRSRARLPCSLLVQSSSTEAPDRRPALLYAYGDAEPSPAVCQH